MRVDIDRSRNGYRSYHGRNYDERLKPRNYHNNDYHSRVNENHPSRISQKPRHYHNEDYSTSNRISNDHSNYSSIRFDRQTNNRNNYSPLLTDLSGGLSPTGLYYNPSSSTRDRNLLPHYVEPERDRYPPPSSTYRRDKTPSPPPPPPPPPSSSSYRNDYTSRNNSSDLYIRDEYRSPTHLPYDDIYQANDYNNRSERYDVTPNRNGYAMTSIPSPVYRTSSNLPLSSSPPVTSTSLYVTRDQYTQQQLPSIREIDYRSRSSGMTTSIDHRQIVPNKSSDRYYDDYHSSSSYRNRSNLKRLNEKRTIRR